MKQAQVTDDHSFISMNLTNPSTDSEVRDITSLDSVSLFSLGSLGRCTLSVLEIRCRTSDVELTISVKNT